MHHGEQLKSFIEQKRINVSDFAKRMGVERQTIYQMYKRPTFTLDLIHKLKQEGVNIVYDDVDNSVPSVNEPLTEYGQKNLVLDTLKYVIETQKEFIIQQKDLIDGQRTFIQSILKT